MATIDDINNPQLPEKQRFYPSVTPSVNDGSSVVEPLKPNGNIGAQPARPTLSFEELYKKFNTYTPPTQEELEQERRKQKRDMVLASVGNGLNAMHQAYANSRGVKPMTADVSLTGKVRDRYEKIKKERDALSREYANGYLRAAGMDQEQSNWLEKLGYQKERDAINDKWKDSEARRQQGNIDREHEYKKERDKASDERFKEQMAEAKRQHNMQNGIAWANHKLAVQAQKDNRDIRMAGAANRVRGKQICFSDGKGNRVSIYENVWKGSMEQVFDAMAKEFKAIKEANPDAAVPVVVEYGMTQREKDDMVKQHWHKSASARQIMAALSNIDPANMTSTTEGSGSGLGWGEERNSNETDW